MTCLTCGRSHAAQTEIAIGWHEAEAPTSARIAAPPERIAAPEPTVAQVSPSTWRAALPFRRRPQRRGGKAGLTRSEPQRSWEVDVHLLAGMP